jgi:hypothetical protein
MIRVTSLVLIWEKKMKNSYSRTSEKMFFEVSDGIEASHWLNQSNFSIKDPTFVLHRSEPAVINKSFPVSSLSSYDSLHIDLSISIFRVRHTMHKKRKFLSRTVAAASKMYVSHYDYLTKLS